jgi:hypothetical protein
VRLKLTPHLGHGIVSVTICLPTFYQVVVPSVVPRLKRAQTALARDLILFEARLDPLTPARRQTTSGNNRAAPGLYLKVHLHGYSNR